LPFENKRPHHAFSAASPWGLSIATLTSADRLFDTNIALMASCKLDRDIQSILEEYFLLALTWNGAVPISSFDRSKTSPFHIPDISENTPSSPSWSEFEPSVSGTGDSAYPIPSTLAGEAVHARTSK
jgi:hypothetical protein